MLTGPLIARHKMNLQLFDALIADMPLCLSSLRLLVPPLQLMCASMWQVLKQQDVMNYWKVAEFVSLVTEMVPDLLFCKHRDQLILGMKARHILELCRIEYSVDPKIVTSHLDRIRLLSPTSETKVSEANFLKLVHSLLKDPEENEHFFKEVFPAEYGSQYDKDLQRLFWEFLCRLAQLLPPPNLQQTASWLGNAPVVEDCVHIVSESQHLKSLLQHFKNVGNLDKHVPPSPMGDCIVSALSFIPMEKDMITINQASCQSRLEPSQNVLFDTTPSFVNNVEEEKISVTDYAEVELGTTSDSEVIIEGNHNEETTIEAVKGEAVMEVNQDEVMYEAVGKTLEEHKCGGEDLIFLGEPNVHSNPRLKKTFGRHECPDCEKTFKFASALIAHRVIHTGERPFGCNECGRCFSFRQSLDRHKQTHKEKCRYDCGICEDTFPSLFACTEHKNNHMEDGVYVCPECHRKFTFAFALARHLKRHTEGKTRERLQTESKKLQMEQENVGILDYLQEVAFAASETHQDLALNGEKYDVVPKVESDQPAVKDTTVVDNGLSFVKARTSGRKRKPTMKVQIINLQKRIAKVSSANKRVPDVKAVTFNSTEHSYGSPKSSSREEGKNESHLQQPMGRAHCDEAREQTSTFQPHTEQNGRYTCLDCEKSFKFLSLLRAHQHVHTGRRPYLCSQCGRHFSFKQSLKRHKHTHKDGCKYVCLICGAFFKSVAAQREHNSSHMQHGLYRCPECDRTFAWKSTLVRHLKTHTVEAAKSGEGSHCELGLSGGTSLNNRFSTHQAEKLHSCSCGKSFAYKSGLKAHQRTHIKERPHQCQECGKGFLYKGGLLSHMKIHSEDMPYSCSFCGKSFKRERNMKKHERCHTGENVFSCSQCDKSFVYKATLIRHELTHSGERPFLCSECGKGFFSHAELLKHERFHTGHKPFQCPHCGKRFTQSCYLTIHLRYHTGARPYSCSHCNKSFLSANRLKRHQRTHTGEKPYLCGECGKGFKESYNLKMHQRTHTPKFR